MKKVMYILAIATHTHGFFDTMSAAREAYNDIMNDSEWREKYEKYAAKKNAEFVIIEAEVEEQVLRRGVEEEVVHYFDNTKDIIAAYNLKGEKIDY